MDLVEGKGDTDMGMVVVEGMDMADTVEGAVVFFLCLFWIRQERANLSSCVDKILLERDMKIKE